MAYIPPHKRHSEGAEKLTPTVLDPPIHQFRESLHLGTARRKGKHSLQGGKIVYAKDSISRWWPAGSTADDPVPAIFHLEPFSKECVNNQNAKKTFVLVHSQICLAAEETEGLESNTEPWVSISEKILPHLLVTLQNVRDIMQSTIEAFKPSFVARFGKILFYGGSSFSLDDIRKTASSEADTKFGKSFYTNVPREYIKDIKNVIVPKTGLDFDSNKEHYHVKIFDKANPDSTISCKCIVREDDKRLEVYKVELNQVRYFVADISCLYKDLDLRMMLSNKRKLTEMDEEEKESIKKLIDAAIIDQDIKGGLRWPMGKSSVGDRFSIVGVWHTRYTSFRGSKLRLKLRTADRFDFRTSSGEVSNEVSLKMTQISTLLQSVAREPESIREMLEGTIKLIWDNFLDCKYPLA